MAAPWRPEGWVPNPAATDKFVSSLRYPTMAEAGKRLKAVDKDVLLYLPILQLAPKYKRPAQQIGSCVGHGFSVCVDALSATEIAVHGEAEDWPGRVLEASIYGFARCEISNNGRPAGLSDGSHGAAAAAAVTKYGVLHYDVDYAGTMFKEYSGLREKQWGNTGVPNELEPRTRRVKETTLVRSFNDYAKALSSGYTVGICSDQGFNLARSEGGWANPRGQWRHCMGGIGLRGGKRPGGLICNSWGNAHSGPHYPENMPQPFRGMTFWVDADVLDRMLKQGDSFALSSYDGFPARKLPSWTEGVF